METKPGLEETQAHTGEHILFQSLSRVFKGMESVKVQISPEKKQLFVKYPGELSWEAVLEAEQMANRVISEDRAVLTTVGDKEALRKQYGNRLRGRWDLIQGNEIRIIEIDGFDCVACTGNHVATASEVGLICVKRFLTLGKDAYEVIFETGEKARQYLLETKALAMELVQILGTRPELARQTLVNMKNQQELIRRGLREASHLALQDLGFEEHGQIRLYQHLFHGIDEKELLKKAGELTERSKTVVVLVNAPGSVIVGRSQDIVLDMLVVLRQSLERLGGKCGGRSDFAFAGGLKEVDLDEALATIRSTVLTMLKDG